MARHGSAQLTSFFSGAFKSFCSIQLTLAVPMQCHIGLNLLCQACWKLFLVFDSRKQLARNKHINVQLNYMIRFSSDIFCIDRSDKLGTVFFSIENEWSS